MSDTPYTDEHEKHGAADIGLSWVYSHRCRTIERDRDLAYLKLTKVKSENIKLEAERDELRAELAEWKSGVRHLPCEHLKSMLDFAEQTATANKRTDELRAEVERLKADKALLEKVIEVAGHKMLGAAIKETMGDAQ